MAVRAIPPRTIVASDGLADGSFRRFSNGWSVPITLSTNNNMYFLLLPPTHEKRYRLIIISAPISIPQEEGLKQLSYTFGYNSRRMSSSRYIQVLHLN